MNNRNLFLSLACGVFLLSNPIYADHAHQSALFQVGNASALFAGASRGDVTYRQVKAKGDFGLGTFNDIDGELVALNGDFYKMNLNGKTTRVDPDTKTPFVQVVKFQQKQAIHLHQFADYLGLKQRVYAALANKNMPYAIKITGTFHALTLRSRSSRAVLQTKDIQEATYSANNIKGTLVGFWFPAYLLTLTVPEFHFHFISDDRKLSGHVLALTANAADVFLQPVDQVKLVFPQTDAYKKASIQAATLTRYQSAQIIDKLNFEKN